MRIEGEKWARKTSSTSTAEITIPSIRLGGLSLRCPRGMQVKMSKKPSGWGEGGWSSELRRGLWVCETFLTLLDNMTVKGVSERIH